MKLWKDDNELFAIARNELFTALVGDSLGKSLVGIQAGEILEIANDKKRKVAGSRT